MKTIFKALILCSVILCVSCSNNDDTADIQDTSSIVNKWYYDSNGVTADVYFDSDGTYQQRISALGQTFESSGNWLWLDEEAGMMKINNLTGQVQVATEVWFRFSNITETSFTIEQSLDNTDFFSPVNYQDTDPED